MSVLRSDRRPGRSQDQDEDEEEGAHGSGTAVPGATRARERPFLTRRYARAARGASNLPRFRLPAEHPVIPVEDLEREGEHRGVLRQVHLAGERVEEVAAAQTIHDRPLHLGQVQCDARVGEARVDRLQALERARVDEVDRRALQHDVAERGVGGNPIADEILEESRVREVQALVDPDREHTGRGDDVVALDVAKVLGARDLADDRPVRARGAVQVQRDRQRTPATTPVSTPASRATTIVAAIAAKSLRE